jgi:threonyl-tRNA synthetase
MTKQPNAAASDHRSLGHELGLYATHPLVGPGLPLWLPDGAVIRSELEKLAAEEAERTGCRRVYSPVLAKRELYERSGHWSKFAEDMFPVMTVGGEDYVLRPANCPHHAMAYASTAHSFRDLPVRFSELGSMFRSELSGVLSGLSRVRQINLDDAHVFCTPDQVRAEVVSALGSIVRSYAILGIEVRGYRLSLRGESADAYLGSRAAWLDAEAQLAGALDQLQLPYQAVPGEAAFYGPKVDVQVRDASGREETLSTVQLDFNQPERFGLEYVGSDGAKHRPVLIHRGVLGSMERMVALLVEQYQGRLPPWLAPLQLIVLPVSAAQVDDGRTLADSLREHGIRVRVDEDGSLGSRVRQARLERTAFAVIGPAEAAAGLVDVALPGGGGRGSMARAEFVRRLVEVVAERRRAW